MTDVESAFSNDDLIQMRAMIAGCELGTLASLLPGEEGFEPYASAVLLAADAQGQPLLFVSELSDHTRNMRAEPTVSLLLFPEEAANARRQRLNQARVSLQADACFIDRRDAEAEGLIDRFVACHPEARIYRRFSDFRLIRLVVRRAHFIGGFGHARWYSGEELFPDLRLGNAADGRAAPDLSAA